MDWDSLTQEVHGRYKSLLEEGADPNEWAYAWRSEFNRGGFKAVDMLMDEVVNAGKCVGCAACVTICPVDVFDYENENPVDTRDDACVFCELCVDACPVLRPTDQDLHEQIGLREPVKDEGFGPYSYGVLARTTREYILKEGQDGGICSALIIHGMQQGTIKAAVVGDEDPEDPSFGYARLATTEEEVMNSVRSRYTYQPNTLTLVDAMKRGIAPLAVVGVPCQVDGVRQQQFSSIRLDVAEWYRENISLVIGLFCSEAFTAEGIDWVSRELDVERRDLAKINIKGKVEVTLRDGREEVLSLKKFGKYARPACLYCIGLCRRQLRHRSGRYRPERLDLHRDQNRSGAQGLPGPARSRLARDHGARRSAESQGTAHSTVQVQTQPAAAGAHADAAGTRDDRQPRFQELLPRLGGQ